MEEHIYDEVKRLRLETRRLKEERDILKKAVAYFAQDKKSGSTIRMISWLCFFYRGVSPFNGASSCMQASLQEAQWRKII
ncbi:MAG: hypothetical protein N2A40_01045 [Desulfobulbaceae bacterium]